MQISHCAIFHVVRKESFAMIFFNTENFESVTVHWWPANPIMTFNVTLFEMRRRWIFNNKLQRLLSESFAYKTDEAQSLKESKSVNGENTTLNEYSIEMSTNVNLNINRDIWVQWS